MGDRYVRITIGTHDQNLRLIDTLKSVRETT
jgi:histidinol-phosphate/aromatic aminotransferase/cobyric acid decarboxylase-like protein